ncbi:MAG: translation initiation factor IF-2, partial [Verrucomicrobiota bacterium]|nr:translation initiation factor IF-2 [Verrucomicrobiota bacterium]
EMLEGRAAGVTLENIFDTIESAQAKVLKVIIKADTQGSAEAIVDSLNEIESEKVNLEVIHSAVGTINESDINLAASSSGVVLGFHTRIDKAVPDLAKHHGVQIKTYKIIYELVDEVKDAMAGLLDPIAEEVVIGSAEVRELFPLSKGGVIAGCVVSDGRISRGKVRVMRNGKSIFSGETESLRRFKENVDVVRNGMDCGIHVRGFDNFEKGDVIESFKLEQVAQKL